MREYGYMTVFTSKQIGLWTVELAQMQSGTWQIIMTRDTDCLYDCISFETESTARKMYRGLTRVRQIMDFIKNGSL